MLRRRERWTKRMLGLISVTKRIALAAVRMWPSGGRGKRASVSHQWEVLPIHGLDDQMTLPLPSSQQTMIPTASPTDYAAIEPQQPTTLAAEVTADFADCQPEPEQHVETKEEKRLTLREIPFCFTRQCAPCELPEDVERLIFEMVARGSMVDALHTLVFVNHRIRKWVEYVIYESVILRDAKHARLFLDALERKHPEFASGAVKILALPTRVSLDTSLRILTLCKDIRHLSWLPMNPVPDEISDLVANLPLISFRARLSSFVGANPDFSAPLFNNLQTLFVADHQDVWKMWRWEGLRSQRRLKWLAFNLDGRLDTSAGWVPVRALEKTLVKPYGGEKGIRLCICYSYGHRGMGDRWIHRSEDTFSEERMAVLSLDHRIDERGWEMRINGERHDFEISEQLVRERLTEERRLKFERE